MENARLRAEVATQYAHEAARSLLGGDASHMAASMQRSQQIGEPQVTTQLPASLQLGNTHKFALAKQGVRPALGRSWGLHADRKPAGALDCCDCGVTEG